jgi:hypothetical protein
MSTYLRALKTGPVAPLIDRWRWLKLASPEKYGGSYLKNAMVDIPECLVATGIFLLSVGVYTYMSYVDRHTERYKYRPYRDYYTVMRKDDPRVARIHPDYYRRNEDIYDFSVKTPTRSLA